jgi:ATP-dependent DNA helicase RecQ
VLLGYFGEAAEPCGNCDLCDRPAQLFDATEAVRKALSAILRTGEWFGAGHLIDILTGTSTPKVREKGHDQLPTFAVGRDLSKPAWGAVFRQMMGRDLVRPDPDRHGALRMTDAARPVLRGEATVTLRRDTVVAAGEREPAVRAQVAEEDLGLLALLKAKRRALAEAQNVPAYVVFPDKTLIEMAERKPATLDQMAGITGVGARKLESYGTAFLEVITGAAEGLHPARMRLVGRPEGALFDRLAEVQLSLARGEDGTGKYLTCAPATLRAIVERRPSTLAELAGIGGMGEAKVERFGEAFLALLRAG